MKYLAVLLVVLIPQSAKAQMFFPILPPGAYYPMPQPPDPVRDFMWSYLAKPLQQAGIKMQILDPRECRYVFSDKVNFYNDLKLFRDRYKTLENAPSLEDAARWPERTIVNDMMAFNRAYRTDLVNRLALDTIHQDEIRAAIAETDILYRIWDAVRDLKCDYYYISVRRQAMMNLRDLIGARAYYTGELPPFVPIWRIPVLE